MKKKGFFGDLFENLGEINPDDHEIYARIGQGLLKAMETHVAQAENTLTALDEEIAEYQAEWQEECRQTDDWPLGEILTTAYLGKMTQLNAKVALAYRITDSWRDKNYGIIS